MTDYRAEDLIFLDETGAALNLLPAYGRAPKGQRVVDFTPTHSATRISTIGALSSSGMLTAMCFEGTLHGGVFSYFIQHFLRPHLQPGKVLILDNARAHYDEEARDLIESTGVKLLFLPTYAPEMNPIEYFWSSFKHRLRKQVARTKESLYQAIEQALEGLTPQQARAYFQHCGFCTRPTG